MLKVTDAAAFTLRQSTVGFAGVAAQMLEGIGESEQADLIGMLRRAVMGS